MLVVVVCRGVQWCSLMEQRAGWLGGRRWEEECGWSGKLATERPPRLGFQFNCSNLANAKSNCELALTMCLHAALTRVREESQCLDIIKPFSYP